MKMFESMSKLLEMAGQKYTKLTDNDKVTLTVQVPQQEGCVKIVFADKGDSYLTSSFFFNDLKSKFNLRGKQVSVANVTSAKDDDYGFVLNMIKSAKQRLGDYYEVESEDKKYVGIIYLDRQEEFGTVFVFVASNKQFLGVFGY